MNRIVLRTGDSMKRLTPSLTGRATEGKIYVVLDVDVFTKMVQYRCDTGELRWFNPFDWAWEKVVSKIMIGGE